MIHKALIRFYFWGEGTLGGGGRLTSHDTSTTSWTCLLNLFIWSFCSMAGSQESSFNMSYLTPCFNILESTSYHRWVNSTYQKRASDLLKQRNTCEGFLTFINHTWRWLSISCHVIIHTEESKNNMFSNDASHGRSKNMHPQEQITPSKGHKRNAYSTINYSSTWNIKRKKHLVSQQKNT